MTFFHPLSYTQKLEEKIMKNFILKIVGLILVLVTLTACGGGNVNMVKTGVFNDYQGTTVGDAFDSWSMCENTSWTEFQTENGRNIVEYKCKASTQGYDNLINTLNSFDADVIESITETICAPIAIAQLYSGGPACKFTMNRLKSVLRDGITYTVQFQVNLDDSFEISYLGASSPNVGEVSLWEADILTPVDFLDYVMYNNAYLNEASSGGPVDIISSNIATLGDMELLNR